MSGAAACANVAGAQAQTAAVTVANTLSSLEKVTNSAEVEQSQEQSNECQDIAVCANVEVLRHKQPVHL